MLPAYGAVHASHLIFPNLEYVIGETTLLEKKLKPNYKIISGSKNRPMMGLNLRKLLQESFEDIFQHSTNPDRVFEAGTSLLNRDQEISLFVLGNTSYLPSLRRTLKKKGFIVTLNSNSVSQDSFESHVGSESIAIIGMSGRFPGSDTIEELWKSIMQQKECHRKVRLPGLKKALFFWLTDMSCTEPSRFLLIDLTPKVILIKKGV